MAIFVALKAGDGSVLPLALPVLLNLYHEEARVHHEANGFTYTETFPYPQPEASMPLAIAKLRTPQAIPSLTRLANEATDGLVRDCAAEALHEIKRLPNKDGRPYVIDARVACFGDGADSTWHDAFNLAAHRKRLI